MDHSTVGPGLQRMTTLRPTSLAERLHPGGKARPPTAQYPPSLYPLFSSFTRPVAECEHPKRQ